MLQKTGSASNVVLFGLGEAMSAQLGRILAEARKTVYTHPSFTAPQCLNFLEKVDADLVFCAAQPECYRPLLEAIHQRRPGLPVVVVGRWPEVTPWLDALEAGASDYCIPPFDSTQVGWILEAALRSHCHAA